MKLVVNGAEVEVDDRHAKTPLLWVLRDVLGLHGTKFGCGAGFCAACTVLIDGRNTKSCQTATERAVGEVDHDGRGRVRAGGRRGPRRVAPRQRRAVRVLPARSDAGRGVAARVGSCPGRREDRRVDERQPVPLRHLSADPGGHSRRPPAHSRPAMIRRRLSLAPDLELRRLSSDEMADPVHPYIRIHDGRDDRRVLEPDRDGPGNPHGAGDDCRRGARRRFRFGPGRQRGQRRRAAEEMCTAILTPAARLQITGAFELDEGLLGPLPVGGRTGAGPARGRSGGALGRARRRGRIRTRRRTPRERQGGDVRAARRACGAAAGSRGRQAEGAVATTR